MSSCGGKCLPDISPPAVFYYEFQLVIDCQVSCSEMNDSDNMSQGGHALPVTPDMRNSMLYAVRVLSHKVDQHVMRSLRDSGVEYSFLLVLRALWSQDGLSQKEIARICVVTESTLAQVLNSMARDELIVRVPDERDARIKRICLTEKARALQIELAPIVTQIHSISQKGLSDEEIVRFLAICEKVHANLTAAEGTP